MPPGHRDDGLRAATALRERFPGLAVLVLSQYVETRVTAELLGGEPGRVGYLLKDRLTERESAVLALMAQGHANARIAGELHLSVSSTEKHINAIFDKLELNDTGGVHRAGGRRRALPGPMIEV